MSDASTITPDLKAIALLISDINHMALDLKTLCYEASPEDGGDIERSSALIGAAEKIAGVIGWQADNCLELLNAGVCGLHPEDEGWLMPRAYQTLKESVEVNHDQ